MSVFLYRLGRACVRHRWRTIGAWLISSIALIGLNNAIGGEMTNGFVVPGLDSQEAYDLLADRFPAEGGINAQVVVEAPAGSLLSDSPQRQAIEAIGAALSGIDGVEVVVPPVAGQTISPSGTIGLFRVAYNPDFVPSLTMLDTLEETGR
ncbi:MAG: MMPL family transporter, partial [Actinomycetota bacterium]|nr:MMPL family transporter [Actinomycetota bacterium]